MVSDGQGRRWLDSCDYRIVPSYRAFRSIIDSLLLPCFFPPPVATACPRRLRAGPASRLQPAVFLFEFDKDGPFQRGGIGRMYASISLFVKVGRSSRARRRSCKGSASWRHGPVISPVTETATPGIDVMNKAAPEHQQSVVGGPVEKDRRSRSYAGSYCCGVEKRWATGLLRRRREPPARPGFLSGLHSA